MSKIGIRVIFFFNFIFVIVGLVLMVVGIVFKLYFDSVTEHFENTAFKAPIYLLIAIGAVSVLTVLYGCSGVIKKNFCVITTYGIVLLILFALQVTAGILSFTMVQDSDTKFKNNLNKDLNKLFKSSKFSVIEDFNFIQKTVKCCGVNGTDDYTTPPDSCYGKPEGKEDLYHESCSYKLFKYIDKNLEIVGYVALGLCAFGIIGVIISFCLASSFRKENI